MFSDAALPCPPAMHINWISSGFRYWDPFTALYRDRVHALFSGFQKINLNTRSLYLRFTLLKNGSPFTLDSESAVKRKSGVLLFYRETNSLAISYQCRIWIFCEMISDFCWVWSNRQNLVKHARYKLPALYAEIRPSVQHCVRWILTTHTHT